MSTNPAGMTSFVAEPNTCPDFSIALINVPGTATAMRTENTPPK